jgi:hypothetical protein
MGAKESSVLQFRDKFGQMVGLTSRQADLDYHNQPEKRELYIHQGSIL